MTPEEERLIERFILQRKDELLPEYDIINSLRRNERYQWDDIIYCCWAYANNIQKQLDHVTMNLLKEIEKTAALEKMIKEDILGK